LARSKIREERERERER
jgi:hypothetical protein